MVTQITLKTEGPHGLPSGRQTEADPLYRGLIILTDYDCGQRFTLERTEPCANATTRERGGWLTTAPGQGLRIKPDAWVTPGYSRTQEAFSVRVSRQESNPWGSVLRVICVTIEQSYNRGCTIARWLRRSLLTRNPTGSIPAGTLLRKKLPGSWNTRASPRRQA